MLIVLHLFYFLTTIMAFLLPCIVVAHIAGQFIKMTDYAHSMYDTVLDISKAAAVLLTVLIAVDVLTFMYFWILPTFERMPQ